MCRLLVVITHTSLPSVPSLFSSWVESQGAIVGPDPELSVVEVSPLVSYEGEGLGFVDGREFNSAYEADLQGLAPGVSVSGGIRVIIAV